MLFHLLRHLIPWFDLIFSNDSNERLSFRVKIRSQTEDGKFTVVLWCKEKRERERESHAWFLSLMEKENEDWTEIQAEWTWNSQGTNRCEINFESQQKRGWQRKLQRITFTSCITFNKRVSQTHLTHEWSVTLCFLTTSRSRQTGKEKNNGKTMLGN